MTMEGKTGRKCLLKCMQISADRALVVISDVQDQYFS